MNTAQQVIIRLTIAVLFWPVALIWFLILIISGHIQFGLVLRKTGESLLQNYDIQIN